MSKVTQPRAGIPIASVTIGGVSYDAVTNPEFVRFFNDLFSRSGGVNGAGSSDLSLSQFEDAGIEETKALLANVNDALWQKPVSHETPMDDELDQIAELRAQVDELRRAVEALQQGVTA